VPDDCDVTEPVVVTPAVSFTDPTCDTPDGAAVDVTEIDGVSYTVTGDVEPGGSVEVTATVDEGVTLAEGAQLVWTHDFPALEDCDEPITEVDAEEEERTPPATTDDPDEVEV